MFLTDCWVLKSCLQRLSFITPPMHTPQRKRRVKRLDVMGYVAKTTLLRWDYLVIALYSQCEFKLQSRASLPLLCHFVDCELPCDRGILIMYASCVRAMHVVLCCIWSTTTFLPLNHRRWGEWDALKYWLMYRRVHSSYTCVSAVWSGKPAGGYGSDGYSGDQNKGGEMYRKNTLSFLMRT